MLKIKPSATKSKPSMIGRPLMVTDPDNQSQRFLSRSQVPPEHPVRFLASEPFTVLGIKPAASAKDIVDLTKERGAKWLEQLPDDGEWEWERSQVQSAMKILGTKSSCMEYRGFARTSSNEQKGLSRKNLQRRIAKTLVSEVPGLKNRQRLNDLKSGGLVGLSFLSSVILLIVVLTLPLGGVTIFGLTLFASTILASWGPLALLPAAVLLALGTLGAHWYRKHKAVFRELQELLQQVIERMETAIQAADDVFLLQAYRQYQEGGESFGAQISKDKKKREQFIENLIHEWVSHLVGHLGNLMNDQAQGGKIRPETFFDFLAEHPGEVHEVFEQTSLTRIAACRDPLILLAESINQGE